MAYDVKVHIDLTKPIGTVGFGVPLILVENAAEAVAYTEVSSLADVVSAGFEQASEAYKAVNLIFMQDHAPKQVAICAVTDKASAALADEDLTGKGWRQLIVVGGGETGSAISEIIAAIETLDGKMFFASLDVDDATSITTDGLRRTVLFYCDATDNAPHPVAALVGDIAGRAAGSFTYKNLTLKGIEPQKLSDAQIQAIHAKGGMTFIKKAGDNVTSEGMLAGGEYIDIIDCEDYIIQQLAYQTQKLLNTSDKVPYDNNGIGMLESVAINVLQGAYVNGMIADKEDGTPNYSVSYAKREDTSEENRATRRYLGGQFSFALAGAVHEVEITGTIAA